MATALIDPGHDVGVLVFFFPVLICSSRQFIESLCDGLFEFGRDAHDARGFTCQGGETQMLRRSEKVGSAFAVSIFPGNVRELEHLIERAVVKAGGGR